MKNPNPINLMTSEDVRGKGWWAEARDADGHLLSTLAGPPHTTQEDAAEFLTDYGSDCTVTFWPRGAGPEGGK